MFELLPRDAQVIVMAKVGGKAQLNTLSKSIRLALDSKDLGPAVFADFVVSTFPGKREQALIALVRMKNVAAFEAFKALSCPKITKDLLEITAYTGNIEMLEYLLSLPGAPSLSKVGSMLLEVAAEKNYVEMAEMLLARNVWRNVWNGEALNIAADYGSFEVAKLINESSDYALFLAAQFGHIEIVKLMLERGILPDCQDGEALTCASYEEGQPEIVELLLSLTKFSTVAIKRSIAETTNPKIVKMLKAI